MHFYYGSPQIGPKLAKYFFISSIVGIININLIKKKMFRLVIQELVQKYSNEQNI